MRDNSSSDTKRSEAEGVLRRLARAGLLLACLVPAAAACNGDDGDPALAGTPYFVPVGTDPAAVCDEPFDAPLSAATDPCRAVRRGDLLDGALAAGHFDSCSLGYPDAELDAILGPATDDPTRLPGFDAAHRHPLRVPSFARASTAPFDVAATSERPVARAIQAAAGRLGHRFELCPVEAPPPTATPLVDALRAIAATHDAALDVEALSRDAADVPGELQRAVQRILVAAVEAAAVYERALAELPAGAAAQLQTVAYWALPGRGPNPRSGAVRDWTQAGAFPAAEVYLAAARLAAAVEDADLGRFAGTTGFDFAAETSLGRVILRDAADHRYEPTGAGGHVLLLVDTGGDDVYLLPVGAANDPRRPIGVAIDLAGDDQWGYVPRGDRDDGARLASDEEGRNHAVHEDGDGPVSLSTVARQGAARLGIGLLWDLGAGRDHYRSLRMSQGFGLFGVGALRDDGGDDLYEAEAGAQGAAIFGIGLLLDADGNDEYRAYNSAQGFGYAGGAGVLHDRAGDDIYFADPGDPDQGGDPIYRVDQLPGRGNRSMAQGMGFGRRGDLLPDRVFLGGGLGILRDLSGADDYVCSVFCQGSGFWFGAGLLDDECGDDAYDGLYYAGGAGAHFALAFFRDGLGHDRYNRRYVPVATSLGAGIDFTVAFHLDEGGHDEYGAPGLSFGVGLANGLGVFLDLGGHDLYEAAAEPSFGWASLGGADERSALRRGILSVGLFLDVGGEDVYRIGSVDQVRDGHVWMNPSPTPSDPETREFGIGMDLDEGSVTFP